MGKYIPKTIRGQCVHIYQQNGNDKKKGDRCTRKGIIDKDRNFRCTWHRYVNHELRKKEGKERRGKEMLKRLKERLKLIDKATDIVEFPRLVFECIDIDIPDIHA